MAIVTTPGNVGQARRPMDRFRAIRIAWIVYVSVLIVVGLACVSAAIAVSIVHPAPAVLDREASFNWFLVAMAAVAVGMVAGFAVQGRLWWRYYRGQVVQPVNYLMGKFAVWGLLAIPSLLAAFSVYRSHQMVPNLVPVIVALVVYLTQWPVGRAMTDTRGGQDDAEEYAEPK